MTYSLCTSKTNTCYASFHTACILVLLIAIASCDSPSDGLKEEQERSPEAVTENVVTAESMGYKLKITDLGSFIPKEINDAGQIAGSKKIGDNTYCAVLWEDGKEIILEPLQGDVGSFAHSINNNKRVIGRSGSEIPVSWKNGELCRICELKRGYRLLDINDKRQILGTVNFLYRYFVYQNGEFSYFNFLL